MWQTASGFKYLAQENVLHHDIATRNILLDANLTPKISDFGLASATDTEFSTYFETKKHDGRFLPMLNFAPERFDLKCSIKSEVYSFGFLMYEILTRGCPAHPLEGRISNPRSETEIAILKNYVQDESHSPKNSLAPLLADKRELELVKRLFAILEDVWAFEYQKRPTFSYLETELRYDLHDFIGRNAESQPDLNFNLQKAESVYVRESPLDYAVHVRETF